MAFSTEVPSATLGKLQCSVEHPDASVELASKSVNTDPRTRNLKLQSVETPTADERRVCRLQGFGEEAAPTEAGMALILSGKILEVLSSGTAIFLQPSGRAMPVGHPEASPSRPEAEPEAATEEEPVGFFRTPGTDFLPWCLNFQKVRAGLLLHMYYSRSCCRDVRIGLASVVQTVS